MPRFMDSAEQAAAQVDIAQIEAAAAQVGLEPLLPIKELAEPKGPAAEVLTGACDCCGTDAVAVKNLTRIDSGHLFCSACIKELRGA